MKIIKKSLKYLFIMVVVLLLALLAAPFLFKGKIVNALKSELNKNLNATIDFNNNIDVSFINSFPNVSVGINELLILSKNDTFENDTLIFFPNTNLSLDIMSLIKGNKMQVNSVHLSKPVINLLVNKKGNANWDILKPKKDTSSNTVEVETSINLSKLTIDNGYFLYNDKGMDFTTELVNVNHTLKGVFKGNNYEINTLTESDEFLLTYGGIKYLNKVNTHLTADMDIDLDKMLFTFKENELLLNALPLMVDGFFKINKNDYNMDLKVDMIKSNLKNVLSLVPALYQNNFKDLTANGNVDFKFRLKGKMTDKYLPTINLYSNLNNGSFKYKGMPEFAKNINFELNVKNPNGVYDNTVFDLENISFTFSGEPVKASVLYKTPESNPYIKTRILGKIDLAKLRNLIPLDNETIIKGVVDADVDIEGHFKDIEENKYNDYKANGKLLVSNMVYHNMAENFAMKIADADVKISPKVFVVNTVNGTYGKSDFNIVGQLNNGLAYFLNNEELNGNLYLKSTYMNVNEMFADNGTVSDSAQVNSFSIPENLNLKFGVNIGEMIYDIYTLNNSKGGMSIKNGKIIFNKLQTNTMGGALKLNGSFDSKDEFKPFTDITFNASSFNILTASKKMSLIKNYAPILEKASGLFNFNIKMSGFLDKNLDPVYSSMNADGNIQLFNTIFQNSPLLKTFYEKLKIPTLKKLNLGKMNLTFKLEDGKFQMDSLVLPLKNSNYIKFAGFTALDKSVNYAGRISVLRNGIANNAVEQLLKEAGKIGLDIKPSDRLNIGFLVTGSMQNPKVKFSLNEIKNSLKSVVKKELDKKVEIQIEKAMKEARKRAQRVRDAASSTANTIRQQGKINADKVRLKAKQAADKIRKEGSKVSAIALEKANKKVDGMVEKATNPFAKIAAKKAGERLKKEAKLKAEKLNKETEKKVINVENIGESNALKIEAKAEKEAQKVEVKANEEADKILKDAEDELKSKKENILK